MPSNQSPLGALPARFRRQRVLIIGCGDVGLRVAALLHDRVRLMALTSSYVRVPELRARGIVPLRGNLDRPRSLARLAGIANRVVHLAPPPLEGGTDPRTLALLRGLSRRTKPGTLVYGSTSGVYGDCQGDWTSETRPMNPLTPRAMRRQDAERQIRFWSRATNTRSSVLRIPGIYALDRDGGVPLERLRKGLPALLEEDDVYTNHIHADDLARAFALAIWRGQPQRVYNISDDTVLKMGAYFDRVADTFNLPRPPRISRKEAPQRLSVMLLSFMSESRRLENGRMKKELGLRLQYPTVDEGLRRSSDG